MDKFCLQKISKKTADTDQLDVKMPRNLEFESCKFNKYTYDNIIAELRRYNVKTIK